MIDQLPRDIPPAKPSSAPGGSSSSGQSKGSERYSDVVANLQSPGDQPAKELSRKRNDSAKVTEEPATKIRDDDSQTNLVDAEAKATTEDESLVKNPSADVAKSGVAPDPEAVTSLPGGGVEKLVADVSADLLNIDSAVPVTAEDGEAKVAGAQVPLALDKGLVNDALDISAVASLSRPTAVAEAQIVQNSASAADPAAKVGALSTLINGSVVAGVESKQPQAAMRLLDNAGNPGLSANSLSAVAAPETVSGKLPDMPVDPTAKQPVVLQQTEAQRELAGIIKEALEAKRLAMAKGNDPGVDASAPREFGAARELSVLGPLTGSDSLADRLSILKATGGPGAVIEPRHQAAVQSQSLNNLRFMLEQGQRAATIQLHPAELGALKIGIDVSNDQLSVHINAAQAMTREALEMMLPKIRAQLMQQGYASVDISLGGGGQSEDQASSQQQAFAERFTGDSANDRDRNLQQSSTTTDAPTRLSGIESGRNLVDLFA